MATSCPIRSGKNSEHWNILVNQVQEDGPRGAWAVWEAYDGFPPMGQMKKPNGLMSMKTTSMMQKELGLYKPIGTIDQAKNINIKIARYNRLYNTNHSLKIGERVGRSFDYELKLTLDYLPKTQQGIKELMAKTYKDKSWLSDYSEKTQNPKPTKADWEDGKLFDDSETGDNTPSEKYRAVKAFSKAMTAKSGVAHTWITDEQAIEITKDRKIKWKGEPAFFQDGNLYFVAGRVTNKTVVHEFIHPFMRTLRINNEPVFNRLWNEMLALPNGEGLAVATAIEKEYSEDFQDGVPNDKAREEILTTFFQDKVLSKVNEQGVENFIQKIFTAILAELKKLFGSRITVESLNANTSIEEIAELLSDDRLLDLQRSYHVLDNEPTFARAFERVYNTLSLDWSPIKWFNKRENYYAEERQKEADRKYEEVVRSVEMGFGREVVQRNGTRKRVPKRIIATKENKATATDLITLDDIRILVNPIPSKINTAAGDEQLSAQFDELDFWGWQYYNYGIKKGDVSQALNQDIELSFTEFIAARFSTQNATASLGLFTTKSDYNETILDREYKIYKKNHKYIQQLQKKYPDYKSVKVISGQEIRKIISRLEDNNEKRDNHILRVMRGELFSRWVHSRLKIENEEGVDTRKKRMRGVAATHYVQQLQDLRDNAIKEDDMSMWDRYYTSPLFMTDNAIQLLQIVNEGVKHTSEEKSSAAREDIKIATELLDVVEKHLKPEQIKKEKEYMAAAAELYGKLKDLYVDEIKTLKTEKKTAVVTNEIVARIFEMHISTLSRTTPEYLNAAKAFRGVSDLYAKDAFDGKYKKNTSSLSEKAIVRIKDKNDNEAEYFAHVNFPSYDSEGPNKVAEKAGFIKRQATKGKDYFDAIKDGYSKEIAAFNKKRKAPEDKHDTAVMIHIILKDIKNIPKTDSRYDAINKGLEGLALNYFLSVHFLKMAQLSPFSVYDRTFYSVPQSKEDITSIVYKYSARDYFYQEADDEYFLDKIVLKTGKITDPVTGQVTDDFSTYKEIKRQKLLSMKKGSYLIGTTRSIVGGIKISHYRQEAQKILEAAKESEHGWTKDHAGNIVMAPKEMIPNGAPLTRSKYRTQNMKDSLANYYHGLVYRKQMEREMIALSFIKNRIDSKGAGLLAQAIQDIMDFKIYKIRRSQSTPAVIATVLDWLATLTIYRFMALNPYAQAGNVTSGYIAFLKDKGVSGVLVPLSNYLRWGFSGIVDKKTGLPINFIGVVKKFMKTHAIIKNLGIINIQRQNDFSTAKQTMSYVQNILFAPMIIGENLIQLPQIMYHITDEEYDSYNDNGQLMKGKEGINPGKINMIAKEIFKRNGPYTESSKMRYQSQHEIRSMSTLLNWVHGPIISDLFGKTKTMQSLTEVGVVNAQYLIAKKVIKRTFTKNLTAGEKKNLAISAAEKEAVIKLMRLILMVYLAKQIMLSMFDDDDDGKITSEEAGYAVRRIMEALTESGDPSIPIERILASGLPVIDTVINLWEFGQAVIGGTKYENNMSPYGVAGDYKAWKEFYDLMPGGGLVKRYIVKPKVKRRKASIAKWKAAHK